MTRTLLTLCLATALAAGCGGDGDGNGAAASNEAAPSEQDRSETMGEALESAADHSTFMEAVQAAGLTETLKGAGPYTIFAPTNAAFAAIPADARAGLMAPEQRQQLVGLLRYHIVPGTVTAEDLRRAVEQGEGNRAELATTAGLTLSLSREGEAIVIGDGGGGSARLTAPDQIHSNGIVHGIDGVLMPAAGE